MLEKLLKQLGQWNKLGAIMSKRPVAYFASENAKGEYAGWLRTKAWFETQIAMYMDLESDNDSVFSVEEVKKQYLKAEKI